MYASRSKYSGGERVVLAFDVFGANTIIAVVNDVGILTHRKGVIVLFGVLSREVRETPARSEL